MKTDNNNEDDDDDDSDDCDGDDEDDDTIKTRIYFKSKTYAGHARLLATLCQHSGDLRMAARAVVEQLWSLDNEAISLYIACTYVSPKQFRCDQTINAFGLHCFYCCDKISGKHWRHNLRGRTMTRTEIQSIKELLYLENNGLKPNGASLILPRQRG